MKKLVLGVATAALLITAAPAMAAGIYIGPGGFGVDVGPRPGYRACDYYNNWCNGYYDYYDDGPSVVIGDGWHGHAHFHGHFHHH
jgi:hypothetical protein